MKNRKVIKSGNHISDERAYNIIKAPIVTEKSTMASQYRQFVFETAKDANKIEIRKAIEKKFDVKVSSIRTMLMPGKVRQQMTRAGRFHGRRPEWKKAIVTLIEGDKLELFENA